MSESLAALEFDLPKAIEVELSNKTFQFLMSEIPGKDFILHSSNV